MNNKYGLLGSGLIVGILMGTGGAWGWMTLTAPPPEVLIEPTVVKPERIVKVVDEQALYEAKRQIEELKRQLADADNMVADLEPKQPVVVKMDTDNKNDLEKQARSAPTLTPEQQAEIQAQRDAFREQIQQSITERNDFLASIDTNNMNGKQRAAHDKLVEAVNRMNELRATMMDGNAANSSDLRKEMHDLGHSMDNLYKDERTTLLEITGKNMGYKGGQAKQFADQIQAIYDNTSSSRGMFWGGSGGSRHGGGNPSGPRN